MESDPTFRVASIGPFAARAMARGRRGRVVAVFERSAYLDFAGDLVCLGLATIGNGALNAIVEDARDLRSLRLAAGIAVERNARELCIGDVVLDFSAARVWHPVPLSSPIDRAGLAHGAATVRASMTRHAPIDGIACLVTDRHSSAALAPIARAAVDAFSTWLSARDGANAVAPALAALIGLGPGLTPSGDDFLGGAQIALRAFGEAGMAASLAASLRPLLDRTHPVSAAHLRAACEGMGGEALHACVRAMAIGDGLRAAIERAGAIGHTSGWDALAGVLLVGEALTRAPARVAGLRAAQPPRSTRSASSAACAFDGATLTPAPSSVRTCRE